MLHVEQWLLGMTILSVHGTWQMFQSWLCSLYISDVHVAITVIEATDPASDVWSWWEDIFTSVSCVCYYDHALLQPTTHD